MENTHNIIFRLTHHRKVALEFIYLFANIYIYLFCRGKRGRSFGISNSY